jgi:phosphatidylglycerophosphatase A
MGTPAIAAVLKDSKSKDPSSVVIDEWAGMFLIFALFPVTAPASAALLFVFFRLFDIVKPGPVRWAERLPGAYGVMADDLVAGLMAALLFFALQYWQLPWW